ncbi:aminopeptidase N [Microbulbifer sp. SH-1]|uniref:aminopeptidase N n=1 Tax=Microbulbifer sp. SH-1 TaxID=2681547 RepID=UPI001409D474|nr:aminopeptidase N [Microbulbifer sp. SH-1]QIL91115.1 aminopeptidase N [Microbulbifer sp. SH-1]
MPRISLVSTIRRTAIAGVVFSTLSVTAAAVARDNNQASLIERPNAPLLTAEYAALRRAQIADVDYTIAVKLDGDAESFTGVVTADTTLAHDLKQPLTVDFAGGDVKSVRANGKPVKFHYNGNFISIAPRDLRKGENSIVIEYSHPYSSDGSGLHRFKDQEDGSTYLYTHFEPYKANRFFPHFDQPDLKARYTVEVTAPADWQVITTAREEKVKEVENGLKRWYFPQTKKFSSYIFPLHAGPYAVWESDANGIPLRLFARKAMAEYVKPEDWFKFTRESFDFYQKYFDIPYPFGKYDQVIVPDFTIGAMENVAAVTFNEAAYVSRGAKTQAQRQRLANVIAHEMAHMWFGDLVTMKWWNGLWLKESFATYMASLALAENSEFEDVWQNFYLGSKRWAYGADQLPTTHPIEVPVPNTDEAFSNFDGITYGKGGSVLNQLPYYLGKEEFRQGVSNYLKQYSYGNAELDDFMGALGKAANKDLQQWTQNWLYKAGVNTISASFQCDRDRITSLTIEQSAPEQYPVLRSQKVQLGIYRMQGGKMTRVAKVPAIYSGARTEVKDAVGMPCPQILSPNDEDWAYVKTSLDGNSVAAINRHINDIESPFTRLMLWQSLYDSVTDAKLPLTDWIEFALANASKETDINVIRLIAGHLESARAYLFRLDIPQSLRKEKLQAIEDFAWRQLNAAPQKSDAQKTWFQTWSDLAQSKTALKRAERLLDHKMTIKGLEIDKDRSWPLIALLNRNLFGDYEERINRQLENDSSDRAQLAAISARAGRPTLEAKSLWLDNILDKRDTLKLSQIRAAAGSLFPAEQLDLYRQLAPRLFAAVPQVSSTGDTLYNKAYAMLFPVVCVKEDIAAYNSALTNSTNLMPALGRVLKDRRQQSEWCRAMDTLQHQANN